MMMTACDLGAVTKPWDISRKVLFGIKWCFLIAIFLYRIPEMSYFLNIKYLLSHPLSLFLLFWIIDNLGLRIQWHECIWIAFVCHWLKVQNDKIIFLFLFFRWQSWWPASSLNRATGRDPSWSWRPLWVHPTMASPQIWNTLTVLETWGFSLTTHLHCPRIHSNTTEALCVWLKPRLCCKLLKRERWGQQQLSVCN